MSGENSQPNALHRKLEGAPRWMVTFADLMALLFALFVLLLTFADVDSESFKRNAGPIRDSFGLGGQTKNSLAFTKDIRPEPPQPSINMPEVTAPQYDPGYAAKQAAKGAFVNALKIAMAQELFERLIELVVEENRVVIRFPDKAAFPSGSRDMSNAITPALDRIANILRETQGDIQVSGHTDDAPISTALFRSNWDLSTARAVSVVHYLVNRAHIDPARIAARGFADSRPLATNSTPENRAVNRRVEISVEVNSLKP